MRRLLAPLAAWLVLSFSMAPLPAAEISFWEDFALAKDRAAVLKQLIPGTEDYYYFHSLHFQNTEQYDQVGRLLKVWIERHGRTARVREIETRQALLTYGTAPQKSLQFIRSDLSLRFDHRREAAGEKPNLPTALDPALISRQALLRRAQQHKDLRGFENSAMWWLAATNLSPEKRRLLLQRLQRPDLPGLVALVDADLKYVRSGGFGSLNIHKLLLRNQLDELVKLQSTLLNHSAFVRAYVTRLAPGNDEDWGFDKQSKLAHLERMWGFVKTLGPIHNSLKAHVLYRRLAFDRTQGVFDRVRFETYLRLPRNVGYVNRDYLKRDDLKRYICNLGQNYPESGLPAIGIDEPLVRSYLLHFFTKDADYKKYLPYVETEYLKQVFAEAKIVAGVGNGEQWAALLPPVVFQQLKERVDLDFAETNQRLFATSDPVALDIHIKNVKTLLVKVFKINAEAFYRANSAVVNTDIELDGLVPNWQQTLTYDDPPLRRVRRHFEFPELTGAGVYVVDFIGNGKSSRAVIQKGQLRAVSTVVPSGQSLSIFDEQHKQVNNASVLLGGKIYPADEDGNVLLPFSTKPGSKSIVIIRGKEAYLDRIQHDGEQYSLIAGIYVDKESLLARRKGRILIRPQLNLNGSPVSVKDLEDTELNIVSVDLDGIKSTQHTPGIKLRDDQATEHEFLVPPRLASLQITLTGKIKPLGKTAAKQTLSTSKMVVVNNFDQTELVADLHLAWIDNKYALMLLGRTGEPLADRAVRIRLKHPDFTSHVEVNLKTDLSGVIDLGGLPNIARVSGNFAGFTRDWPLAGADAVTPSVVNGAAGQTIQIPLPQPIELNPAEVSLLEMRQGNFVSDQYQRLKVDGGLLLLENLAAGDYELLLKGPPARRIVVQVTKGPKRSGHLLGATRYLESRGERPLAIRTVAAQGDKLQVQLQNPTKYARVHVLATRVAPAFSASRELGRVADINPAYVSISRRPSMFAEGRKIGDEYRYILERQLAVKFPGNMLERPSLLLNPWALRTTEASTQDAKAGDRFGPAPSPNDSEAKRAPRKDEESSSAAHAANLDFLAAPSVVLANLIPDQQGRVSLDLDALGDAQHIRVVATDPRGVVQRSLSLPDREWTMLDLRLANGLKPNNHFIQTQAITTLEAGQSIQLTSGATRVRTYDSLSSVYQLMTTLNPDPRLADFRFVLEWPSLSDEEKRKKYSEFACHELNFFLAHKDPKFFEQVITPYLANKHNRTFLDQFLLSADVLPFTGAWQHQQLNVVERILIGHQLRQQAGLVERHVQELFDLLPPNPAQTMQLFTTAMASASISSDDDLGEVVGLALQSKPTLRIRDGKLKGLGMDREQAAGEKLAKKLAESSDKLVLSRESLRELGREQDEKNANGVFYKRRANEKTEQLYQPLDKTMEWAENNYYKRAIAEQNGDLVTANAFWNDYAHHPLDQPFLSKHFTQTARNVTESMMALAVLDLPFEPKQHEQAFKNEDLTIKAGSRMIVLHEELQPAELPDGFSTLLVSQNFFQQGDRYRHENNQRLDKYVTEEFLTHTVYGCQMVVTNPTSAPRQLAVLFQLPEGAIAVAKGKRTDSTLLQLGPYATATVERLFYFPSIGKYPQFPVHVSQDGSLLAAATPHVFNVVASLSRIDRTSWDYISQNGTNEDVIQYLRDHNLQRTNLDRIAFRMADADFFKQIVEFLGENRAFNRTLWSYAVHHDVPVRINEFLQHENNFVSRCGMYLDSELLQVDPVERRLYQHLDYRPLVNARAHQLGANRQILNDRLSDQYDQLMRILACRRELSDAERMSVTYYLLLQDRVELALEFFADVNRERLQTKIQYDYFAAYTAFYKEDVDKARDVAERYVDHPVDRWRQAFAAVRSQVDEIGGAAATVVDPENREQQQGKLASNSPSLDLKIDGPTVLVDYQNVKTLEVRYYLMDVELLFSRNPFVQEHGGSQFSYIQPNLSKQFKLDEKQKVLTFALPGSLRNRNILVEVRADGVVRTKAHYSNSMAIQVVERYGNLRVTDAKNKPLPKVYVKAYARFKNGEIKFYKDGYTDLRGRFDYSSLSTNELDRVARFALLILSDDHGAKVQEVALPAR